MFIPCPLSLSLRRGWRGGFLYLYSTYFAADPKDSGFFRNGE
jgi:hypothetical protein